MLSKMRLAILKYSRILKIAAMSKYNALSNWELSLTLAIFPLLAAYSSVKLISEETIKVEEHRKYLTSTQTLPKASFNLFYTAQTFEFSPDDNTL